MTKPREQWVRADLPPIGSEVDYYGIIGVVVGHGVNVTPTTSYYTPHATPSEYDTRTGWFVWVASGPGRADALAHRPHEPYLGDTFGPHGFRHAGVTALWAAVLNVLSVPDADDLLPLYE